MGDRVKPALPLTALAAFSPCVWDDAILDPKGKDLRVEDDLSVGKMFSTKLGVSKPQPVDQIKSIAWIGNPVDWNTGPLVAILSASAFALQ